MKNNKFDGPSFVNPNHTSQGLGNNTYQHPTYVPSISQTKKDEAKKTSKKGPKGGWESDEENDQKSNKFQTHSNTSNNFIKKKENLDEQIVIKTTNVTIPNNNTDMKKNKPASYWDEENSKKLSSSILTGEYENKIIDDILLPTGVTLKPSDNQIKDFIKRLKSLKKELVFQIMIDRIKNYENTNDSNFIKTLTKCLFVFEAILIEKIEGVVEFVNLNQNLFYQISNFHSKNKKIVDLCGIILSIVNGRDPKLEKKILLSAQSNFNSQNLINENEKPVNSNVNLFDFGNKTNIDSNKQIKEGSNLSNANTISEKKTFGFIKKRVNEENNKINKNSTNNDLLDLLSVNNDNSDTISNNSNNKIKKENTEKTGFSFIKSNVKSNIQNNSNNNLNSDPSNLNEKKGNLNFDLLNEIYSQSVSNNEIIPNKNNTNINILSNIKVNNINQNNIQNNQFYNINYSNQTNEDQNNQRKSGYSAPNFDMIFSHSSDMNDMNTNIYEDLKKEQEKNDTKTNDQFDFLSELSLTKLKK